MKCPNCKIEIPDKVFMSYMGRKGGLRTKELGRDHFVELGHKGMAVRWGLRPKPYEPKD